MSTPSHVPICSHEINAHIHRTIYRIPLDHGYTHIDMEDVPMDIPAGKRLHSCGKLHPAMFMGKLAELSMAILIAILT